MDWLEPWYAVEVADHAAMLVEELKRELSPAHPLFGIPVRLLGRRDDRDDFLFGLLDGSDRVAEAHLTFRGSEEPPPWPVARTYESRAEWEALSVMPDQEDWEPL